MNKITLYAVVMAALLVGCETQDVSKVKKHHLAYCESYSVEEVMNRIMTDVKWSVVDNKNSFPYVIAEGKRANGKFYEPAKFILKSSETGLVEVVAYEINGKKRSSITAPWIFSEVCSDEYLKHLKNGIMGIGGMISDFTDKVVNKLEESMEESSRAEPFHEKQIEEGDGVIKDDIQPEGVEGDIQPEGVESDIQPEGEPEDDDPSCDICHNEGEEED